MNGTVDHEALARSARATAIALLAAMAAGSLLILAYGQSPARVYALMLARTWGDAHGFGQVLARATPLLFTGMSVALAFRAGLFNVGAEGQLLAGSFATAILGAALPKGTPAVLAIPACVLAGAAAGALLGAIPGVLKARFGAHEVINGIMLNFIAQALLLWAGSRWFFVEQTLHTRPIVPGAHLPGLGFLGLGGSAASLAFPLALVVCGAAAWWLARTRRGFELGVFGENPRAAEAAGISAGVAVTLAMTASGALAGLVGAGTVMGHKGYFETGLGSGAGFMGIAVALLGRGSFAGIVGGALLFGTLAQGGLAASALVPKELVDVLEAVIVLVVAVMSAELRRAVVRAPRAREVAA